MKPGRRKSWAFIYRRGEKMTELGLGGFGSVSLVEARIEAAELRGVLAAGSDPRARRERKSQSKALQDTRSISFETTHQGGGRHVANHHAPTPSRVAPRSTITAPSRSPKFGR